MPLVGKLLLKSFIEPHSYFPVNILLFATFPPSIHTVKKKKYSLWLRLGFDKMKIRIIISPPPSVKGWTLWNSYKLRLKFEILNILIFIPACPAPRRLLKDYGKPPTLGFLGRFLCGVGSWSQNNASWKFVHSARSYRGASVDGDYDEFVNKVADDDAFVDDISDDDDASDNNFWWWRIIY